MEKQLGFPHHRCYIQSILFIQIIFSYFKISQASSTLYKKDYYWLSAEAISYVAKEFKFLENHKINNPSHAPPNLISSAPFLSCNSVRNYCWPHVCEKRDECKSLEPGNITDGSCIFVEASSMELFMTQKIQSITAKFNLYTDKTDDQSNPAGQGVVNGVDLGLRNWNFGPELEALYKKGNLLSYHAVNSHWHDRSDRPPYLHCSPIGLENRDCRFGKELQRYLKFMEKNSVLEAPYDQHEHTKLLLIVADRHPAVDKKPDRQAVLDWFTSGRAKRGNGDFYDAFKSLGSHEEWLTRISKYPFTLAPHGHGLDTHRMFEILLMGGIPVIKRSHITSCYDDSDNILPLPYPSLVTSRIHTSTTSQGIGRYIRYDLNSSSSSSSSLTSYHESIIHSINRLNKYYANSVQSNSTSNTHTSYSTTSSSSRSISNTNFDNTSSSELLNTNTPPPINSNSTSSSSSSSRNNNLFARSRGSIPVVVVDDWKEVNESRLLQEWQRIKSFPPSHWDWRRLFAAHWIERLL